MDFGKAQEIHTLIQTLHRREVTDSASVCPRLFPIILLKSTTSLPIISDHSGRFSVKNRSFTICVVRRMPSHFLKQIVQLACQAFECFLLLFFCCLRIDVHGGFDVSVSHHGLNHLQVALRFTEPCRKGMSQNMA